MVIIATVNELATADADNSREKSQPPPLQDIQQAKEDAAKLSSPRNISHEQASHNDGFKWTAVSKENLAVMTTEFWQSLYAQDQDELDQTTMFLEEELPVALDKLKKECTVLTRDFWKSLYAQGQDQ
mmetsp:Transcript_15323/g.32936  ORF Transcript_15323/g.32936 Transcript_15323/m.32936 type:complete len:127 (+) Transcript_15323:89-469(+)